MAVDRRETMYPYKLGYYHGYDEEKSLNPFDVGSAEYYEYDEGFQDGSNDRKAGFRHQYEWKKN